MSVWLAAAIPVLISQAAAAPAEVKPRNIQQYLRMLLASDADEDVTAIATVRASVAPDGRVLDCAITESTGIGKLDEHICFTVRRTLFNESSQPDVREYSTIATFFPEDQKRLGDLFLDLKVASMPAAYQRPLKAVCQFDRTGTATSCRPTRSAGSEAVDAMILDAAKPRLVLAKPPTAAAGIEPMARRLVTFRLVVDKP